jgi:hypothetical protein
VEIKGWVALLDILDSGFCGQIFFLLIFRSQEQIGEKTLGAKPLPCPVARRE